MKSETLDDRYFPVRRGALYCSPHCGGRCTYADFLKADEVGTRLAKRLGEDWRCHTWENLGWHYSAVHISGRMTVYQHGLHRYWATTNTMTPQIHANAATARGAVENVRSIRRAAILEYNDFLEKVTLD